uniref:Uncharacterized protein n=1 Tax=Vitis vinifera TaxID=29760 RepID=F6H7S2_VITVI
MIMCSCNFWRNNASNLPLHQLSVMHVRKI